MIGAALNGARTAFELLRIYLAKHDTPVDADGLRGALGEGYVSLGMLSVPTLTDAGISVVESIVRAAIPPAKPSDEPCSHTDDETNPCEPCARRLLRADPSRGVWIAVNEDGGIDWNAEEICRASRRGVSGRSERVWLYQPCVNVIT